MHCLPNQQVSVGDVLISLQSQSNDGAEEQKSSFPESTQPPIPSCAKDVQKEHSAVLEGVAFTILKGYACEESVFEQVRDLFENGFEEVTDFSLWAWIVDALDAFADIGIVMDRNILLETSGELSMPADLAFFEFCRRSTDGEAGAITALRPLVLNALRFYNIDDLEASNLLRETLMRIAMANTRC